jgi:hypothetical protein
MKFTIIMLLINIGALIRIIILKNEIIELLEEENEFIRGILKKLIKLETKKEKGKES